jgi:uncharacterized membrane protein YccF (DUF307 family)
MSAPRPCGCEDTPSINGISRASLTDEVDEVGSNQRLQVLQLQPAEVAHRLRRRGLAGILIAIAHVISGCLLCLPIIGIPLGVANFKFAGAALVPFGKEIVNKRDLQEVPEGQVVVSVS